MCEASGSRALNLWMSQLYAAGVWIANGDAQKINSAGRHFLNAYSRLAQLSHSKGELRYTMIPKIHMLWHIIDRMVTQASSLQYIENPAVESTPIDEDFIGRFCSLTRAVSPRLRIRRAMERYLTQLQLLWRRIPIA